MFTRCSVYVLLYEVAEWLRDQDIIPQETMVDLHMLLTPPNENPEAFKNMVLRFGEFTDGLICNCCGETGITWTPNEVGG